MTGMDVAAARDQSLRCRRREAIRCPSRLDHRTKVENRSDRPLFDVILSSPPKHAGEPRDLTDRGWHAGPAFRDVVALFEQARERLKPGGRVYVMVSSDSDLDLFSKMIDKAGFRAKLAREYSIFIESFLIYELSAS
jgi:16S rRNA G1207 methylase RsmC